MYRKERKKRRGLGVFSGLIAASACFACAAALLTLLLNRGLVGESLLRLLLPLGCLISGTAGAVIAGRNGEDGILPKLLAGTVPAGCLLCCGLLFVKSGADGLLLWDAAAFLLPPLAAMLPSGKKTRKKRR